MIGYAYIDYDLLMHYRTKEYIDEDNPGFFSQNKNMILKSFCFNTESADNMKKMIKYALAVGVKPETLEVFMYSIGIVPIKKPVESDKGPKQRREILPDRIEKKTSGSGD